MGYRKDPDIDPKILGHKLVVEKASYDTVYSIVACAC